MLPAPRPLTEKLQPLQVRAKRHTTTCMQSINGIVLGNRFGYCLEILPLY